MFPKWPLYPLFFIWLIWFTLSHVLPCFTIHFSSLPTFSDLDISHDFVDSIDINSDSVENFGRNLHETELISETTIKAVALLRGPKTYGVVRLVQKDSGATQITGFVSGLFPFGRHGFHVHQYKVVNGDCESAGPHYNPTKQNHGSPHSPMSHVGDFGNLQADAKGTAQFDVSSEKVSLKGKFSIIERSLVVHLNEDDLGMGYNRESLESGNSGSRIACGTIKFVSINKSR